MSDRSRPVAGVVLRWGLRLLGATWRFREECVDSPEAIGAVIAGRQRAVIACWHGSMLPVWYRFRGGRFAAMVSASRDGELLTGYLTRGLGYASVIRGSSSRGGGEALEAMEAVLAERSCVITPDGPRGPRSEAKVGALVAARRAGVPILAVGWSCNKKITFGSWDRMMLPLPFATVYIRYCIVADVGDESSTAPKPGAPSVGSPGDAVAPASVGYESPGSGDSESESSETGGGRTESGTVPAGSVGPETPEAARGGVESGTAEADSAREDGAIARSAVDSPEAAGSVDNDGFPQQFAGSDTGPEHASRLVPLHFPRTGRGVEVPDGSTARTDTPESASTREAKAEFFRGVDLRIWNASGGPRSDAKRTGEVERISDHERQEFGRLLSALAIDLRRLDPPASKLRVLRWLLWPLAAIYGAGQRLDAGLKRRRRWMSALPVVSVGGISAGGSGKTPFTIALAETLSRSRPVLVLSRGYGRRTNEEMIWRTGEAWPDPDEFGDEPSLIARAVHRGAVAVGADRSRLLRRIEREFPDAIVILDDGFQHVQLARDLDIVLVDHSSARWPHLLPMGRLRESPHALARADLVDVTRGARTWAEQYAPGERVGSFAMDVLVGPRQWRGDGRFIATARFITVTGIARPERFRWWEFTYGMVPLARLCFRDHVRYGRREVDRIVRTMEREEASVIVTTEKDAVKLERFDELRDRLFVVPAKRHLVGKAVVVAVERAVAARQSQQQLTSEQ